jgi:galactokinase
MTEQRSFQALIDEAEAQFRAELGRDPRWVVAAPGRVNLIGEHTDYNDGFVFPMAIERYTVIAADRPADPKTDARKARVLSTGMGQWASIEVDGEIVPGEVTWSSYVQGSVAGCLAKGLAPGSFEGIIHSDVPLGGGLSSSAALEVATATLVEAITGTRLDPVEKALLCQKAEHDFARMPCGIMDQFISVMAQPDCLMLLDCRSREPRLVRMADPALAVLIVNSNVKHKLTGGEYAERRSQCEQAARVLGVPALRDATGEMLEAARDRLSEVEFRRARHAITEDERTLAAAEAIERSDWEEVGRLMYGSHESLRDDYEVSCDELDQLVEIARSIGPEGGVIGSRMTGGGFGGCTVSLVRSEAVDAVTGVITEKYSRQTGIAPTVFASRPAAGARIVKGAEVS